MRVLVCLRACVHVCVVCMCCVLACLCACVLVCVVCLRACVIVLVAFLLSRKTLCIHARIVYINQSETMTVPPSSFHSYPSRSSSSSSLRLDLLLLRLAVADRRNHLLPLSEGNVEVSTHILIHAYVHIYIGKRIDIHTLTLANA